MSDLFLVSLLGLVTTSSCMAGVAIGLYVPISKKLLAGILAFAAGALIAALGIELAFKGAQELHHKGFLPGTAWIFIAGGFAGGAVAYYIASLIIERMGGAVRTPALFHVYVLEQKQERAREWIGLLSKCDLVRHLPAETIETLLPYVKSHRFKPGTTVFRAGDTGNALYIVAHGTVQVDDATPGASSVPIAELGPGGAFGEMALLTGGKRTATVRTRDGAELLEIDKKEFQQLVASDPALARAVQKLSHARAINNLRSGGSDPSTWARVASDSMDYVSREEENRMLKDAGHGAGLAIILGNILDTIPGCLVIGSNFTGLANFSPTLMLGMFLGGLPEAAASAVILKKAGYRPGTIFWLWSSVLFAGVLAAAAGKAFLGSESLVAIFCEAIASGAVFALVVHAMIPEAIHEGRSRIVLPAVAGFLVGLYMALDSMLR